MIDQGKVTIPKVIREELDLDKGDTFEIEVLEDE